MEKAGKAVQDWKRVSKRSSGKRREKDTELGVAEVQVDGKWLCKRPRSSLQSQRTTGAKAVNLHLHHFKRIFLIILYRRFRKSNSAPTTGAAAGGTTGCAHRKKEARVLGALFRRTELTGSTFLVPRTSVGCEAV